MKASFLFADSKLAAQKSKRLDSSPVVAYAAGFLYFCFLFISDSIIGWIRLTFLLSRLGTGISALVKGVLGVVLSWHSCCWVINVLEVSSNIFNRCLMGIVTYITLMMAKSTVAVIFNGGTFADFFSHLMGREVGTLVENSALVILCLIPVVQTCLLRSTYARQRSLQE
mmetsp:Transcript_9703/g.11056  ORF Transcript_9703/g.11056 Transcript_9703/m.11056 type:complete len:169 (-) Transcript_9703:1197-1703(-)